MRRLNFRFGSKTKPFPWEAAKDYPVDMAYDIESIDEEIERLNGDKPFDSHELIEHFHQLGDQP